MFTGLVEAQGIVRQIEREGDGRRLVVSEPGIAPELILGESVAVSGVCLTVIWVGSDTFAFQAGPETLQRTNLGQLQPGDSVNLERSLRMGDRLGGHLVQGHIDGMGTVDRREVQGDWETFWFGCEPAIAEQIIVKGSVAVDGISLTVVDTLRDGFSVALIPHTLQVTTLGRKVVGATVNLETDVLAKYVWKCVRGMQSRSGNC